MYIHKSIDYGINIRRKKQIIHKHKINIKNALMTLIAYYTLCASVQCSLCGTRISGSILGIEISLVFRLEFSS